MKSLFSRRTLAATSKRILLLLPLVLALLAADALGQQSMPLRINCPPNLTNWTCGVTSTAVVVYPAPTTTGSCPTNAVATCTPPSGATFILGTTAITCRATNSCRESATCTFAVTVARDTSPPVIQCPTNRMVWLCTAVPPDAQVSWPAPGATDNADKNVAVTCSPPSGSLFPPGTTTVTCTATDDCTNRSTCTFTVTIARDVTPPAITCRANISTRACSASGAVVSYPAPTVTDNADPNVSVTCTPASGSLFPVGSTTVTCTATDDCTNRTTCTFLVRVTRDTTPPVIQCPSNIVLWTCSSSAITHYAVTATDDYDTNVTITCVPPVGTPLPVGDTTVNCTARDDCGNTSQCSFQVRVIRDTTPPAIECPSNMVFNCLCPGNTIVLDFFKPAVTDDHDPNPTIVCVPPSLVSSPGVHIVTCTATDNCGNSNQCSFTVTFNYDTTPPVLTCQTNMIVRTCGTSAVVSYPVTAADTCDASVDIACVPPSGSVFPAGMSVVVCTATDNCTNRSTCTFTVTVRPSLLYGGLCHSPLGLAALTVNAGDELEVSDFGASGEDGVRIDLGESQGLRWQMRSPAGQLNGDLEVQVLGLNTAGQEIQVSRMMHHYENGKLSVTPSFASYEVKLLLRGEIVYRRPGTSGLAPVQFCTPVQDAHCVELEVPDFIYISGCNSFVAIECTSETDSGPVLADTMVITPEVPGPQVTAISAVQILGRNLPMLTLHRERLLMFGSSTQPPLPHRALGQARLIAQDVTLTVADLGPSGQDGARIDLGESHGLQWRMKNPPGTPEGDIDIDVFGRTTAGAEVPVRRISHHYRNGRHSVTPGSGPYKLQLFRGGQLVFQQGGRTGDVDIPDCHAVEHEHCVGEEFHDLNPGLLPYCISFLTIECDWNTAGGPVSADTLVLTPDDPLPPGVTVSAVQLLGRNVRDLPSLMLLTERGLTFVGTELRLACPPDRTVQTCATNPVPVTFPPPVVAGGHCTLPATVVCIPSSGSLFLPGTTTVACTVTNLCGERAVCSFVVSIIADSTAPAITCPADQTAWTCTPSGAVVNYPAPPVSDNLDPNPSMVCVPPSGSLFPVGQTLVTCTATDSCTNRSVCVFRVIVNRDTTAPTIQCPTNLTILTCTNFAVAHYDVGATDDCDKDVDVVCTPPSGSSFPVGVTAVTCVARDDCGHTVTCVFDVSVRVSAPRITVGVATDGLLLSWPDGTALEEADAVDGPWRIDPDAHSPYRVATTRAQRFFRLAVLGDGTETRTFCPGGEEINPRLMDVLSHMHYASTHGSEEFQEYEDVSETPPTNTHPPRVPAYDPRSGAGYSWNSAVGRRFLLDIGDVGEDREGVAAHAHGSIEQQIVQGVESPFCVDPDYYVEAGDRVFSGWSEMTFQAPKNAFATKAEAEAFLLKVHAEQPFFLPFTHPDVKLGHGWYYNDGGLHRACDYSRSGVEENEDPTFLVTSAGNGVVVATDWDGNGGNYVAVEHTAPGGQKVMFIYLHLRNGRSHDIAKARSSTSSDEKYVKYRAFANGYPDHLSWGSESHAIMVNVGDPVSVGTPIARAGNTGAGGAGAGLNDDGSPQNWKGNVHLHVYVAVPHPTVQNTWVWVDPYGVYQEVDTGCYDLLKDTKFSRLYAPFYPTFHGVPYEVFKYYWGYYPDMSMKLRTLSIHRHGNSLLASGSFESGIPGGWYLHTYKTADEFQTLADEHYAQGYIMRETTVEKTIGGQPRYSAIWRHLEPGESIEHRAQLTDAQWGALWQDRVVEDEWRLEDYFGYSVGGVDYHSAFVTSHEGRPFLYSGLQNSTELDKTIDEYKSDGFLPVNFNAASRVGGLRFSGIFRDLPGCWKVRWGLTPSGYQSYITQQVQLGYRVWKVQGYANSGRYGVVLHDPTGPCQ